MEDVCACHLLQDGCDHGSNEGGDSTGDCCDHEDCCHDPAEPPFIHVMIAGTALLKRFSLYSTQIPPEVYLAIFVPPES